MVSIPQQDVLGEVRIQRTATSMVPDLEDRPYLERLKELIKIKRLKIKRHDSLDIINYNHGMWKHTSLDLCLESVFVLVFFIIWSGSQDGDGSIICIQKILLS